MEDKKDYIDFLRASIKQNKTESLSSNVKTLSCKNEVAPLHNGSIEPLLVTGVSGCFPGCESVSQFWEAIDQDKSLITEIPEDRFSWKDYYAPTSSEANKMVTKWGGFIPDIASFDPDFFQISPAEAEEMDPRQRLLLMSTWHTLEDAGIAPLSLKGSNTGIFIGCEANEY
ncbi:MAG: polyketide synthase, partial [Bacteroidota bacterium]